MLTAAVEHAAGARWGLRCGKDSASPYVVGQRNKLFKMFLSAGGWCMMVHSVRPFIALRREQTDQHEGQKKKHNAKTGTDAWRVPLSLSIKACIMVPDGADPDEWRKLEVKESLVPVAGMGLFAREHLKAGEIACDYRGTVLTLMQTLKREDRSYVSVRRTFTFSLRSGSHSLIRALERRLGTVKSHRCVG